MKMSCNLKIIFASLVRVKSYLRCYFQDLFTKVSVVATMPTIMIRPTVILKSKFVNI